MNTPGSGPALELRTPEAPGGDRPPLLFVHGLGHGGWCWDQWRDAAGLVPIRGVRATAARYGARLEEFPGMGHDLMLDARWREPLTTILDWLAAQPTLR